MYIHLHNLLFSIKYTENLSPNIFLNECITFQNEFFRKHNPTLKCRILGVSQKGSFIAREFHYNFTQLSSLNVFKRGLLSNLYELCRISPRGTNVRSENCILTSLYDRRGYGLMFNCL